MRQMPHGDTDGRPEGSAGNTEVPPTCYGGCASCALSVKVCAPHRVHEQGFWPGSRWGPENFLSTQIKKLIKTNKEVEFTKIITTILEANRFIFDFFKNRWYECSVANIPSQDNYVFNFALINNS